MKIQANIRSLLAEDSGENDVWGWGIGHWFDVANTLHLRGEGIPTEWRYRPSPLMAESSEREDSLALSELLDAYDAGRITGMDLREAGTILSRYCEHLKFHGVDY